MIESLVQDLRFALRTLRRSPGFTLVAVVTLALGIGSNLAMWSMADAVLFRDLPYEDPDRLMVVWQHSPTMDFGPLSFPTYRDVEERSRVFEFFAAIVPCEKNLSMDSGAPERVQGSMVSDELAEALGVRLALGRDFSPEDNAPGAERTVILSYEFWQRRFAGGEVLGKSIRLDERKYQIIGVLPEGLNDEFLGAAVLGDIWLPVELFRDLLPFDDRSERPELLAVGRLLPDVEIPTGEELSRISTELKSENPHIFRDSEIRGSAIRERLAKRDRQTVFLLLGAVGLVLVIAVANLTNLQLSRLARRGRELAARWALGAEGWSLLRPVVVECLVLGSLGGALGIYLAQVVLRTFPWVLGESWVIDGLEINIALGAFFAALLVSVMAGTIPALRMIRSSRQNHFARMQMRSSLPNKRLRQVLVGLEVGLALTTLIWASLLGESLVNVGAEDPGFASEDRLTFQMILPQTQFEERTSWLSLFDQALERLSALPGVESAALTSSLPLADVPMNSIVAAGDRALPNVPDMSSCTYQMVSPGFFATMEIPIIAGRSLEPWDDDRRDAERVVVISQSLASAFWPDSDAVGKRLAFEFEGTPKAPEPQWRRVVGVVGDARLEKLTLPPRNVVYAPYSQMPNWFLGESSPTMTFVLHALPEQASTLIDSSRSALFELAPETPTFRTREVEEILEDQLGSPRRSATLLSAFAILALALVMVGVFGVVSYVVTARTREIGTRMAFGAGPKQIAWLFLKQTLQTAGAGIVFGLLMTSSLSRLIANLLYGLAPIHPRTYLVAAAGLMILALLATAIPALRAARIRPLKALRHE